MRPSQAGSQDCPTWLCSACLDFRYYPQCVGCVQCGRGRSRAFLSSHESAQSAARPDLSTLAVYSYEEAPLRNFLRRLLRSSRRLTGLTPRLGLFAAEMQPLRSRLPETGAGRRSVSEDLWRVASACLDAPQSDSHPRESRKTYRGNRCSAERASASHPIRRRSWMSVWAGGSGALLRGATAAAYMVLSCRPPCLSHAHDLGIETISLGDLDAERFDYIIWRRCWSTCPR